MEGKLLFADDFVRVSDPGEQLQRLMCGTFSLLDVETED